jgi:hypothetical protein
MPFGSIRLIVASLIPSLIEAIVESEAFLLPSCQPQVHQLDLP